MSTDEMTIPTTLNVPMTLAFTPAESLMWQVESDPSLQFRIVGVVGLDREPALEVLVDRVERLTRGVPRLRHRVVPGPMPGLRPHWELDPHFDLAYHLRTVRLPDGSQDSDLFHVASLARQDDFPIGRPPWRMLLVTGLPEGRAALVLTMNHVITDGIGAVRMGSLLFDLDADGPTAQELGQLPEVASPRQRGAIERFFKGLTQEVDQLGSLQRAIKRAVGSVLDPVAASRSLAEATAAAIRFADPTNTSGSPLPRGTSPADRYLTLQVPVDRLKAAGRVAGGRLNDAYLAALVGGMRRYHDLHDLPLSSLTVSMPVNTRPADAAGEGGNDVLLKLCILPADIVDPAERIAAIVEVARQEQTAGSNLLSSVVSQALSRLPSPVMRSAIGALADTLDLATTNVPGIPVPLFLAGAPVGSMHAFISRGRSPITASLISYQGTAHVGINLDPAAIPDGELLRDCIQAELEAVMALGDGR